MSELKSAFETAITDASQLATRPDNDTLLMLYALYKQATIGNTSGKRPGAFDFVGRAKYDAWFALKGMSQDDAMQAYISLVNRLKA
jgi:diazepam-binding inhibitor (GABA receptor modulator, acyl-CoA-binding protein)